MQAAYDCDSAINMESQEIALKWDFKWRQESFLLNIGTASEN